MKSSLHLPLNSTGHHRLRRYHTTSDMEHASRTPWSVTPPRDALNSFCRSAHCTARSETCGGSSKSHVLAATFGEVCKGRRATEKWNKDRRMRARSGSDSFWKMCPTLQKLCITISIWVFPKKRGTPKSSILIGFSII